MIIALTGATGNLGVACVKELVKLPAVSTVRVLQRKNSKNKGRLQKLLKKDYKKIEVVYGSMSDENAIFSLVSGASYVFNVAGVLPPLADTKPMAAVVANEKGLETVVKAVLAQNPQPKLIHISTMAIYGNRTPKTPYGTCGDPLVVNPFDVYGTTKMRAEWHLLESDVRRFVILRQNPMLHDRMLADNVKNGLMFQTAYNAPLEWVTADESGRLARAIIEKDLTDGKTLDKVFWNRVFTIGGLKENRLTGYDTVNDGFALMGGSAKTFFSPKTNATRNFHGLWFLDGDKLDDLFHYGRESAKGFWKKLGKKLWYFKLGKLVPPALIKKFVFKPLDNDVSSPAYWASHGDDVRLFTYFGKDAYENLPTSWDGFPLFSDGYVDGKKCDTSRILDEKTAKTVNYGFDFFKPDEEITLSDLQSVAARHGGKLLSETYSGSLYEKLKWETQDGEVFTARPYTLLRAGHWYNVSYKEFKWDFDRLSKKDKIYAEVWYESHDKNEDVLYYFDETFTPKIKPIK